jgi:hypothetical protein
MSVGSARDSAVENFSMSFAAIVASALLGKKLALSFS